MKKFLRSVKVYIIYLLHSIPMLFYKKDTYKIYSDEETIDKIINDKLSICRYGDGEFRWMLKVKSSKDSFQKDNNEMSEKLLHILDDRHSKVLVGIPSMLNNCEDLTLDAKEFWIPFLFKYHKRIEKYVKKDVQYCNTNLTRPYMDYKCKDDEVVAKRFVNLKRIWGGEISL